MPRKAAKPKRSLVTVMVPREIYDRVRRAAFEDERDIKDLVGEVLVAHLDKRDRKAEKAKGVEAHGA